MSYDQTDDQTQHPAEAAGSDTEPISEDANMEMDPAFIAEGGKKPINKNAAILGGLVLVGAIVIWFMYFRNGPQTAAAAPQTNAQIKQFLDSGNINLMKQALKDTENFVKQFRQSSASSTQVPLGTLHSNPFRELPPKADGTPVVNTDRGEEERHKHFQDEVAALRLQSVIRGSRQRACMINNTFYREGEKIGDLTVVQVQPKSVVIGGGKYRFELTPETNK